ncbi:protein ACCELERATED CELL DEATH 6-like [Castanea sativa]|uniref:protein ACCELERATED CELL DEATH 6-like n=1 Tax=Castanea sativa TaxID=21020 RepID=UPI003F651444
MEVSSVPTKDGSIAEMNTQHDNAMQEDPKWHYDSIITKLRDAECSLLLERFFDSNTLLHVAASLGHDQIVEAILSKQQCQQELLSATNSTGDLPLHVAANAGHLPIVVQFLGRPCRKHQELLKAQNSNGDLPLHLAANAGHLSIVQHLVKSHLYQELLMVKNSNGDLPLHVAANAGHLSIVQQLVEPSHQCRELLMAKNSNGDHPLHVAANAGHLSIVQYLFSFSYEYQEQLNSENSEASDDPGSVESSIKQQLNDLTSKLLWGKNYEGNTPLHLALIKKYEEVDVNLKSKYNEVAEFLIEKDPAVCNYRNKASKNPRRLAEEAKDEDLSKLISDLAPPERTKRGGAAIPKNILERRPEDKPKKIVPRKCNSIKVTSMDGELYKAVRRRDIDFILKKAQDPEHSALSDKTPELNTILHLAAASSGDHQFVESILEIQPCQKFVTEKNSNGDLPLHVAASAGNVQIVEHLVKWSDKHLKDHCNCVPLVEKNMEENTPLHLALIKKVAKYNKVAKFLVEKCPEVSFYPNKERKSPLYLAAEGGDEELVKLMITTNCLPHGKSIVHAALYYLRAIDLQYGRSIVHTAIYGSFTARKFWFHLSANIYGSHSNGVPDILDTVLKSLPDDILKEKDDKGTTPLFYAASMGYLDGVEILLKKPTKCCAYERDTDGYYPIHIASKKGHIQVIKKFLDKYPDMIELLNEEGQNILHVAAMYGKVKVVTYMLKRHEMLINNKDQNGNTPLHLATMKGHPRVVWHLTWDKRVDLKALNKEGKRALDIALNDSGKDPSFGEQLTWEALRYVSGPRETPQSSKVGKTLSADKYKERTDSLLLVATLVATVTFAAAFTMPGGYNGPGGMATFLEKPMFQVFVISNTIAMYSAITAVIGLIWAHLGDLKLFIAAYEFSLPILGLAITMVTLAFMAGSYLVLRDLNWLAYLVLGIGSFFLFTLSIIFFPLFLPNSSPHPIIRCLLRYPFYLLIMFTRCDTDDREEE